MNKTFIIAEIGINHNGDLDIAKKLIDEAVKAGCDAVKFQKRTIEDVYTADELDVPRESPFGITNREQKYGLEFDRNEYDEIDKHCRSNGIDWFASAWDITSQKFLRQYNLKYNKVASAMLTHRRLLEEIASEGKYTFISTGMSTMEQIEKAVKIFRDFECPFELMHCNSTYPMPVDQANLNVIKTFREKFNCKVGYSGHETGIAISVAAVTLGATSIERHITLDRSMYGSDQSASLEVIGLHKMAKYIRSVELALGSFKKVVTAKEKQIASKLRRVETL